jgi:hypothetical protein
MKRLKFAKLHNILAALAVGYCILSLTSCTSRIKIGSVKLPMSVVDKWLGNTSASEFVFQFSTPNFKSGEPLQLVMYVMDDKGNCLNANNPDLLETKASKTFDESGILGNNTLTRDQLKNAVDDTSSHARQYDYILFTPVIDESYHHIVYNLDLYLHEEKLPAIAQSHTNPCPPGCNNGNLK